MAQLAHLLPALAVLAAVPAWAESGSGGVDAPGDIPIADQLNAPYSAVMIGQYVGVSPPGH